MARLKRVVLGLKRVVLGIKRGVLGLGPDLGALVLQVWVVHHGTELKRIDHRLASFNRRGQLFDLSGHILPIAIEHLGMQARTQGKGRLGRQRQESIQVQACIVVVPNFQMHMGAVEVSIAKVGGDLNGTIKTCKSLHSEPHGAQQYPTVGPRWMVIGL